MKKILSWLCFAVMLVTCVVNICYAEEEREMHLKLEKHTNVFDFPSVDSNVIGIIPKGKSILSYGKFIGNDNSLWLLIEYNGSSAFIEYSDCMLPILENNNISADVHTIPIQIYGKIKGPSEISTYRAMDVDIIIYHRNIPSPMGVDTKPTGWYFYSYGSNPEEHIEIDVLYFLDEIPDFSNLMVAYAGNLNVFKVELEDGVKYIKEDYVKEIESAYLELLIYKIIKGSDGNFYAECYIKNNGFLKENKYLGWVDLDYLRKK